MATTQVCRALETMQFLWSLWLSLAFFESHPVCNELSPTATQGC